MKRLSFSLKIFITLLVLCITGIVFSIVAIDKQIDSYIDEMKTEIQIVNNSNDNIIIDRDDNKVTITINPEEKETEEITKSEEGFYGVVTSMSGLNIRQNPSVESEKIGVLYYGAEVKIIEDCGDWYKTESGFIFKEFILKI